MKAFFNLLTVLSLRFRIVTIGLTFLLMILGGVAVTQLNQELLPPIDVPQTIILAQVSGLTSEQALSVLTERLEPAISEIDEVINLESTTTGTIGSILIAYNDFGQDPESLQADIQDALDTVWFPVRRIAPQDGENPQEFSQTLIGDLSADVVLYLAQVDPNFLFQLTPEVWTSLSDDTVTTALAFLARQSDQSADNRSALRRLVDNEIVTQLNALDTIANVTVSGGQVLPGEEGSLAVDPDAIDVEITDNSTSLLLQLSPDVWEVVSGRIDGIDAFDESAVQALLDVEISLPTDVPELPESWQFDHFNNASDLAELETFTRSLASIVNGFYDNGEIVGALGQTDDLTVDAVTRMLEIEPTMAEYFTAEHLVAMPTDVFNVLPEDFVANLDGFTRDALAAATLAESISGEQVVREPVTLPDPWRIQPPEIRSFSFSDIPLATFSVSTVGNITVETGVVSETDQADDTQSTEEVDGVDTDDQIEPQVADVPEGPALPPIFSVIGGGFGIELDTADDLLEIRLPAEFAQLLGSETVRGADFLNLLTAPAPDPATLPEGVEIPTIPIDPAVIITSIPAEAYEFLAENDPAFISTLSTNVFNLLPDNVLLLEGFAPPLADAWDVLSSQPQFAEMPLDTAADVIAIGNGDAATILNTINANVPQQFEGYEVRLFDSLSPAVVRYFALEQDNFYASLDAEVLQKFSSETLAILPEDFLASLDPTVREELLSIASGDTESAFAILEADLYATDAIPADPTAPALNSEWQTIAGFVAGVREFNNAFDLFRYPEAIGTPADFINQLFETSGGRGFAPGLLNNISVDAVNFLIETDPTFLDSLRPEAVLLFSDEVTATFPDEVLTRALEGGEVFTPTNQVTRTNFSPSLLVTIFKTQDANTVSSYSQAEEIMLEIDEADENITVDVAFEQSSFVEESISGVAREGSLGAVFAVIIILMFLSGGIWTKGPRRIVGIVMIVLFGALMALLLITGSEDVVILVLVGVGVVAALAILIWPGNLPDPAWRATLVIAVSIPLSILTAFVGMRWFSPAMHGLILPLAENSTFFEFVLRIFPDSLTLNIMTLSGLTVAVGRVVDDSIVVLENIFRQMQSGEDKYSAVVSATRDVSSAIFVATLIAVVVFLPLGLTGGIIGAFFLPFGLAVTYALAGSFLVAVTVVPVLAYIFLSVDDMPEESDLWLAKYYLPVLEWALGSWWNRGLVLVFAALSLVFSLILFGTRPVAFLPNFGEPQITVSVDMPSSTRVLETNTLIGELEDFIAEEIPPEQLGTVQTTIGGGGLDFSTLLTGNSVEENRGSVTIGVNGSSSELEVFAQTIREEADRIFGEDNVIVSAASVSDGGFGGFALVVSGLPEDIDERIALDQNIIAALEAIDGIANVSSNLSEAAATATEGSETFIRVNLEPAISYSAELETEDTIGVTQLAIQEIESLENLPDGIKVSQGFESELQTEGFQSLLVAIGIASIIVVAILVLTFSSPVYWFAIFLSVIVAPVGAAIALTLTNRVLGISALIGILMLLGLVITNAVVLIDRVRSNRTERNMSIDDALIEAGSRRLRPILMTSLATIIALMPLTIGLSEGAIIASELGTVVVGGVFSSTVLTLIVVPVMYIILYPVHRFLVGLVGIKAD
ncbi:MAG: efflux RND transporter permease subunit [Aggregatilineales bacterium]